MLAGLRHHRLVRGDDENDEVDAADAGQHVLDESLMARNVDERQMQALDCRMGETEIDGDASRLFLLEPVRIGAGQRLHERALAVVDVARRSDDD